MTSSSIMMSTNAIGAKTMKRVRSFSIVFAGAALALMTILHASANAMTCNVSIELVKGGFIVGLAGGSGTMTCGNKTYQLELGGIKAGLLAGMAKANLRGRVVLNQASDVEGTYAGAGAGIAVAGGVKGIAIANQKGAKMTLSGTQAGLMGDLDLSGTVVRIKR
jgi:hypothetical protein